MDLYHIFAVLIYEEGGGRGIGGYTWQKKKSICTLLKSLFFLFFTIKHVFWDISRRARCEICSKLTIKIPEYGKLMLNLKIKIPLKSFWALYC